MCFTYMLCAYSLNEVYAIFICPTWISLCFLRISFNCVWYWMIFHVNLHTTIGTLIRPIGWTECWINSVFLSQQKINLTSILQKYSNKINHLHATTCSRLISYIHFDIRPYTVLVRSTCNWEYVQAENALHEVNRHPLFFFKLCTYHTPHTHVPII